MDDPIQEFLRRAARHRQQRAAEDEVIDAEVLEDVEIIEPESGVLAGESVAEHVQHDIGSAGFAQRGARLTAGVDAADERMEAHLHQVFEHKLGELGARTSVAADSVLDDDSGRARGPQTSLDIRKLFSTPENVRNAILLNEIIQRPADRW